MTTEGERTSAGRPTAARVVEIRMRNIFILSTALSVLALVNLVYLARPGGTLSTIVRVSFPSVLLWSFALVGYVLHTMRQLAHAEEEARIQLERQVEERTAQLSKANKRLTQEAEERKRTQERLNEHVHFLQELLDSIPNPIFFKDLNGQYQGCNKAFEACLGLARQEIIGKSVHDVVPQDLADKSHEMDLALFENPGVQTYEAAMWYADGVEHNVIFSKATVSKPDGTLSGLVGVIIDITQHTQLEEELKSSKLAAEAANRAKSDFLASMSHELRTPLNAIIGFSQVLQEQYFGELNERQVDYVRDILESGQHLLSLINDILDLSKVELGRMELEESSVSVAGLLERSALMIREKAVKHRIDLHVNIPDELRDLEITADQRRLRQVMFNLLSNAAKFTPDGGSIALEVSKHDEVVTVTVADTGIGIPPEHQDRIFEEFYQVRDELSDKEPGTGLGLALVKQLVELHGGKAWVESEGRDKGSRFGVVLPMRPPRLEDALASEEFAAAVETTSEAEISSYVETMIRLARTRERHFTLCRLCTDPEIPREQALTLAMALAKEKRPSDYMALDESSRIYLIIEDADRATAKIPCSRFLRKAGRVFPQLKVSFRTSTFPVDGETAEVLIEQVRGTED